MSRKPNAVYEKTTRKTNIDKEPIREGFGGYTGGEIENREIGEEVESDRDLMLGLGSLGIRVFGLGYRKGCSFTYRLA